MNLAATIASSATRSDPLPPIERAAHMTSQAIHTNDSSVIQRSELQPADVFGATTKMPMNYVARPDVDGALLSELARHRQIVIHGSSKQGKTCLRRKILEPGSYIEINCLHSMTLTNIHQRILEKAGYVPTREWSDPNPRVDVELILVPRR